MPFSSLSISPVSLDSLPPADSIFQSRLWARFKASTGQEPLPFLVHFRGSVFSLVLLLRHGPGDLRYAYAADAPNLALHEDERGPFLEALSLLLQRELPPSCAFIRFDTVWESPYRGPDYYTHTGQWKGLPRCEIRELRMNWGTREARLRKAPRDHLSPDTVLVSLVEDEQTILARMRQTTRNSIRRSQRASVAVRPLLPDELPVGYELYAQTALRKGIYCEGYDYFEALAASSHEEASGLEFFGAFLGSEMLASCALAWSGRGGYYLFAGSSERHRACMPNYALQWEALRYLKAKGCHSYDLLGVPPENDPNHSMYGLYTFKTGFGGRLIHYSGCWDWPIDGEAWEWARNVELLT